MINDKEKTNWRCPVCGSDEDEILDAKDCAQCKRLVCSGCIQWSGEDHDEPNGEWFCDDCKLSKRLEQLESEIESGICSVGKALMEIRDSKAYLGNHDTFEEYCKERWGFTDRHARDLINAEAVRVKIGSFLDWFCGDK
jgi:hypothetical protein